MAKKTHKRIYVDQGESTETILSSSVSPLYEKSYLAPYNPDELYQRKGAYDLFDKMRKDDQISSILKLKKYIVLSPKWEIRSDDPAAKDYLTKVFTKKLSGGIVKKLYDVLTALDYGFSWSEKVWGRDTEGVYLSDLKTRTPHSVYLHTDPTGRLTRVEQVQNKGSVDIPLDKVFLYSYQKEFDNPYGQSDLNEGVYRSWWSKEAIIKFWNIFLERFGMPIITGTFPKGDKRVRAQLDAVLANIQAKTHITMTEDIKIGFLEAVRSGSAGYDLAIDRHNLFIARAMLVPDLLGFGGGQTSGGSFALGQKHFEIFYLILSQLRNDIVALWNKEIVNPLVEWNFGPGVEAELRFVDVNVEQKSEFMKLWLEAAKNNPALAKDKDQLSWFLKNIDAPDYTPPVENAPVNGQIPGQITGQTPPAPQQASQDVPEEVPELEDEDEGIPHKPDAAVYSMEPNRELTTYERKAKVVGIAKDEEDLVGKNVKVLSDEFFRSINALVQSVTDGKIIEKKNVAKLNDLKLPNRPQRLKAVKAMLSDGLEFGHTTSENVKANSKEYLIKATIRGVKDQLKKWIDVTASTVLDAADAEIMQKAKFTLLNAIQNGLGVPETMKLLDKALSAYDINLGAPSLERIVRTNIHRAFSEARMLDFNEMGEDIAGYQFSAVLDDRTSEICQELDKKIFSVQEAQEIVPPLHFNCRSILVPILKAEVTDPLTFDKMPNVQDDTWGFKTLGGK